MGNIYLVGFMGVGKTAIGRVLANKISHEFVDLDEHIEKTLGMSIPDVFWRFGEAHFRVAERQALQWSTTLENTVVATGGGAFCTPANREVVHSSGGKTVFLDVPWPVLVERIQSDSTERPKFVDVETAQSLYEARKPHYLEATWRIDLDGSESPADVAARILAAAAGAVCGT